MISVSGDQRSLNQLLQRIAGEVSAIEERKNYLEAQYGELLASGRYLLSSDIAYRRIHFLGGIVTTLFSDINLKCSRSDSASRSRSRTRSFISFISNMAIW